MPFQNSEHFVEGGCGGVYGNNMPDSQTMRRNHDGAPIRNIR